MQFVDENENEKINFNLKICWYNLSLKCAMRTYNKELH